MGLLFVLVFWAVIGTIFAGIGSAVLSSITRSLTRGVTPSRWKATTIAGLLPFISLGWMAVVFVFQAAVNEVVLHRDLGLGDSWHCPLPNGYQLLMIDVTDQGTVYNPKTQAFPDGVAEQEDAVGGVRLLQVTDRYLLGGVDLNTFQHFGTGIREVNSYFVLDTQTGKRTTLPSYEALRAAAHQIGVQPNLEPIDIIYSKNRFSRFDIFAGLLFIIPPMLGLGFLTRWIIRLRRTRLPAPEPA